MEYAMYVRDTIDEWKRPDYFLIIDEFKMFINTSEDAVDTLLSEARKCPIEDCGLQNKWEESSLLKHQEAKLFYVSHRRYFPNVVHFANHQSYKRVSPYPEHRGIPIVLTATEDGERPYTASTL